VIDRTVPVNEFVTSLDKLSIDNVDETEFNFGGGWGPDSEVGSLVCEV
jgi:hypothetical protein